MMLDVRHEPRLPWAEVLEDGQHVRLRLTTDPRVHEISVEWGDRYRPDTARQAMSLIGLTPRGRDWATVVWVPTRRLRYRFRARLGSARASRLLRPAWGDWYELPYLYPPPPRHPWAGETVYALFPDRFAAGHRPPPLRDPQGFYGGTLEGIRRHLDYLEALGVGVVYLNPIHPSATYHRYDVENYYAVDRRLGRIEQFQALVADLHARGMRLVLDMVFNHTSHRHPWFRAAEAHPDSPLRDRYRFRDDGSYETFADNVPSMPKLVWNAAVEQAVADILAWWTDQGADGFRLDVANEMPRDGWLALRQRFPTAIWVGEAWPPSPEWVNNEPYTGITDYVWHSLIARPLLEGRGARRLHANLLAHDRLYGSRQHGANWIPLGSHDLPRPVTLAGGRLDRVMMAQVVEWATPGLPVLYYGDEQYLPGGPDPDCRRPFPWEEVAREPRHALVSRLIHWRRAHPWVAALPLRRSRVVGPALLVERGLAETRLLLAVNPSTWPAVVDVPPGRWRSVLDDAPVRAQLTLPAVGAAILTSEEDD
jgi:cyclomaltodextrinase